MTEGVFIAGCVQGPKDIPASVAQGAAAAARVLGRIQQKRDRAGAGPRHGRRRALLRLPHLQHLCPFNAISSTSRRRTEINPALARAAAPVSPPARPARSPGTGFTNEQILAQIEGLLSVGAKAAPPDGRLPDHA